MMQHIFKGLIKVIQRAEIQQIVNIDLLIFLHTSSV